MNIDADVGIVGAGIAGLTAANTLRAAGFAVEVLERAPRLRVTGAGVMLHPNGSLLLARHVPGFARLGLPMSEQVITDPDGHRTVVRWGEVWRGGELPLAVHRRAMAEALLEQLPDGTVRWDQTLDRLIEGDDAVAVQADDGSVRRYRILIGADGVLSRTRKLLGIPGHQEMLGTTYWRTTVPLPARHAESRWRVWRAGSRFFGLMPIGGGRAHVFVQDVAPRAGLPSGLDPVAELVHLTREMAGEVPEILRGLEFDEPAHRTAAVVTSAVRWTSGRTALIGDAVHAVAPATTQGAALAVEDAVVLAAELRIHGLHPHGLTAFAQRRQERVTAFVRRARLHARLIPVLHGENPEYRRGSTAAAGWFRRLYAPLMAPP